jgi:hypothetical protein
MGQAQELLRVVVEDLVGVRLGQPHPLDPGEGLLVGLPLLQDRVVAPRDHVVRSEGLDGAAEAGL